MDNISEDRNSEFYSLNGSTYMPSREKKTSLSSKRSKFSSSQFNHGSNRHESFKTCKENGDDQTENEFEDADDGYDQDDHHLINQEFNQNYDQPEGREFRAATEKRSLNKQRIERLETIKEEDRLDEQPS